MGNEIMKRKKGKDTKVTRARERRTKKERGIRVEGGKEEFLFTCEFKMNFSLGITVMMFHLLINSNE